MRRNKFVRILFHYAFLSAFVLPVYFVAAGTAHAATTVCYSVANRLPNTQLMLRTQMLCSIANMACKFSTPGLDAPDFADRFDACVEKAVTAALGRSGERQELHSDRSSDQQRECDNGTDNAAVIRQCTALIDSGSESALGLVRDRVERGRSYSGQEQYDRASVDYTAVIELASNIPATEASASKRNALIAKAYCFRAEDYMLTKQQELAIADFTKAIALHAPNIGVNFGDGKIVSVYYLRGMTYSSNVMSARSGAEAVKNLKLARADFEQAVVRDPRDATSLWMLGQTKKNLYLYMRDQKLYASGAADVTRAMAMDPNVAK